MITSIVIDAYSRRQDEIRKLADSLTKSWMNITGNHDRNSIQNPYRDYFQLIAGPFADPNTMASIISTTDSIDLITVNRIGIITIRPLLGDSDRTKLCAIAVGQLSAMFRENAHLYKAKPEIFGQRLVLGICDICRTDYYDVNEGFTSTDIEAGQKEFRHKTCNVPPPFPLPRNHPMRKS